VGQIEQLLGALSPAERGATDSVGAARARAASRLASYVAAEEPLCLLDTFHHHTERRWHAFDLDQEGGTHDGLMLSLVRRPTPTTRSTA